MMDIGQCGILQISFFENIYLVTQHFPPEETFPRNRFLPKLGKWVGEVTRKKLLLLGAPLKVVPLLTRYFFLLKSKFWSLLHVYIFIYGKFDWKRKPSHENVHLHLSPTSHQESTMIAFKVYFYLLPLPSFLSLCIQSGFLQIYFLPLGCSLAIHCYYESNLNIMSLIQMLLQRRTWARQRKIVSTREKCFIPRSAILCNMQY